MCFTEMEYLLDLVVCVHTPFCKSQLFSQLFLCGNLIFLLHLTLIFNHTKIKANI